MPNAVYMKASTAVKWTDTTGDLAITLNNLAAGAGRSGAEKDWGVLSTARPTLYYWQALVRFATAPVVGETVDIYWKEGDGTDYTNDDGQTDIALSATDKLKNLMYLGSIIVDEAATAVDMVATGHFTSSARYGMPVVHNNTADNLVASNNISYVQVTPIYPEVQ